MYRVHPATTLTTILLPSTPLFLSAVGVGRGVAGVERAADEPAGERRTRVVEHAVPPPVPLDGHGRLAPEPFGIGQRPAVHLLVPSHRSATSMRVSIPRVPVAIFEAIGPHSGRRSSSRRSVKASVRQREIGRAHV